MHYAIDHMINTLAMGRQRHNEWIRGEGVKIVLDAWHFLKLVFSEDMKVKLGLFDLGMKMSELILNDNL